MNNEDKDKTPQGKEPVGAAPEEPKKDAGDGGKGKVQPIKPGVKAAPRLASESVRKKARAKSAFRSSRKALTCRPETWQRRLKTPKVVHDMACAHYKWAPKARLTRAEYETKVAAFMAAPAHK